MFSILIVEANVIHQEINPPIDPDNDVTTSRVEEAVLPAKAVLVKKTRDIRRKRYELGKKNEKDSISTHRRSTPTVKRKTIQQPNEINLSMLMSAMTKSLPQIQSKKKKDDILLPTRHWSNMMTTYSELRLDDFVSAWPIPRHLKALVQNDIDAPDWTSMLLKFGAKNYRSSAATYNEYLSTCLFLEEIEENSRFDRFNVDKICLEFVENDMFRFEVNPKTSKIINGMEDKILSGFILWIHAAYWPSNFSKQITGRIERPRQQFQNKLYFLIRLSNIH